MYIIRGWLSLLNCNINLGGPIISYISLIIQVLGGVQGYINTVILIENDHKSGTSKHCLVQFDMA